MVMRNILVTNDDGPFSPGLKLLYESVRELGEVKVMVPETPKAASGLGITLHKPLRVHKLTLDDVKMYLINGTPSDIVHVASAIFGERFDLVVSGVNLGDNTSVQVVLSSGTVGAAVQAALEGIPAIAFSYAEDDPESIQREDVTSMIKSFVEKLSRIILEEGMPEGVDVINVNFPATPTDEVVVAPLARKRYENRLTRRVDPRRNPYFWLYGQPMHPEPGSDVDMLLNKGKITITPISLCNIAAPLNTLNDLVKKL